MAHHQLDLEPALELLPQARLMLAISPHLPWHLPRGQLLVIHQSQHIAQHQQPSVRHRAPEVVDLAEVVHHVAALAAQHVATPTTALLVTIHANSLTVRTLHATSPPHDVLPKPTQPARATLSLAVLHPPAPQDAAVHLQQAPRLSANHPPDPAATPVQQLTHAANVSSPISLLSCRAGARCL